MTEPMTIRQVYERYVHLDDALSDSDWCQEEWRYAALYDLWLAIKAAAEAEQQAPQVRAETCREIGRRLSSRHRLWGLQWEQELAALARGEMPGESDG